MRGFLSYGIQVPSPLYALAFDCGEDRSYYGSGRHPHFYVEKCRMTDAYLDSVIPFFQTQPLKALIISGGDLTGCGGIENLFYRLHFHPCSQTLERIDLSSNNMVDYGANYIIESLKSGRYPSLKYIDISSNGITPLGIELIKHGLTQIKQDIVIVYAEGAGAKLAFHKNTSNHQVYHLSLRPTGGRCDISIQKTSLCGVSAGDSGTDCSMMVKEQIAACVAGATGGAAAGIANCSGKSKNTRMFAACVGRAALIGCAANVAKVGAEKCMATAYEPSGSKDNSCSDRSRNCDSGSGDNCASETGCESSSGDMSGQCLSRSYF